MSPDEIVERLAEAYDDAVRDLSVDDAMEVAGSLISYLRSALDGLREDVGQ